MKSEFKKRFNECYKNKRLLAIQLNGFSHRVFYTEKNSKTIISESFSYYTPENRYSERLYNLFDGVHHHNYQNNPKEIIYVMPKDV